jgi:uncharacterized protein
MKFIKFLVLGSLFGIVMVKSEAISWYRIQEMFRFQSFHMYGIIGTAVVIGMLGTRIINHVKMSDISGAPIQYPDKEPFKYRYLLGGIIFGLGWALTGACPGPLFVNLGYGISLMSIVILFALLGTYIYGKLQDKLPH